MLRDIFEHAITSGEMLDHTECQESNEKTTAAIEEVRRIVGPILFNQIEDSLLDIACASEYSGFVLGFSNRSRLLSEVQL